MKGYVYKGCIDEASLREIAGEVFGSASVFHIIEDIDDYRPGSGLPAEFKRKGRLFAETAELRYEHMGDAFECLLLTESEAVFSAQNAFLPVPGNWETTEAEQQLIPVSTPYVNPLFTQYPDAAQKVSVRVYRDRGVTRLTRLRRFMP